MKKVYAILYLVPILLGSTFVVLKMAVGEMSPLTLIAYRFLFASIVMFGFAVNYKTKLFNKKEMLSGLILGLLLSAVYLAETIGIQYTSASNAGFLSDSTLVFVIIFSYFFLKQKLRPLSFLGIIIVFTGMYFLIFTDGVRVYRGDFIVMLAPLFASFHVLITSKITRSVNITTTLLYQFMTVTIVSLCAAIFTKTELSIPSINVFFALGYLGFVVTTFRYFAEIYSMRKINPTNVTLIILMTPIWSAVFAFLLLNEVLLAQQYFGCALILIGLVAVQIFSRERRLTIEID